MIIRCCKFPYIISRAISTPTNPPIPNKCRLIFQYFEIIEAIKIIEIAPINSAFIIGEN